MYYVYAIMYDNTKMVVMFQGKPAAFETDLDAWKFISEMMSQEQHPKFAWVKEVTV